MIYLTKYILTSINQLNNTNPAHQRALLQSRILQYTALWGLYEYKVTISGKQDNSNIIIPPIKFQIVLSFYCQTNFQLRHWSEKLHMVCVSLLCLNFYRYKLKKFWTKVIFTWLLHCFTPVACCDLSKMIQ